MDHHHCKRAILAAAARVPSLHILAHLAYSGFLLSNAAPLCFAWPRPARHASVHGAGCWRVGRC
jgi:hypothetical protein